MKFIGVFLDWTAERTLTVDFVPYYSVGNVCIASEYFDSKTHCCGQLTKNLSVDGLLELGETRHFKHLRHHQ